MRFWSKPSNAKGPEPPRTRAAMQATSKTAASGTLTSVEGCY